MRVPRYVTFGAPALVVALAFAGIGASAAHADDAVLSSAPSASTATTSPEAPATEAPAAVVSAPAQPEAPETQPAQAAPSPAAEAPAPAASEEAAPADKPVVATAKTASKPAPVKEQPVKGGHHGGHHGDNPPKCTFSVKLSHTYDNTANSGAVTATGEFCGRTYFVTPTAWTYTNGDSIWPQDLANTNTIAITKPGTYPFNAPVTCGQGDVYGGWDKAVVPTQHLTGESVEFNEHFLHFDSTGPVSWMKQDTSCYTPPAPPKESVAGTVSFTDTQCLADKPVGNTLTIAGEGKTMATVSLNGTAPKAASNGTFTDDLLGIGGYPASYVVTLTGEDGSTKVFEHTYQQPKTDADCAPTTPVVTPPSATIKGYCTATGPEFSSDITAGSEDLPFLPFVNHEQALPAPITVKAGETYTYIGALEEDSNQGYATVTIKSDGGSISDVISVKTDCLPNTPKPTPTPDNTPTPSPTPTHHDTPKPTQSTAPVAVQHHAPTGGNTGTTLAYTGANPIAPITAAIVLLLAGTMLVTPVRRRIFGALSRRTASSDSSES